MNGIAKQPGWTFGTTILLALTLITSPSLENNCWLQKPFWKECDGLLSKSPFFISFTVSRSKIACREDTNSEEIMYPDLWSVFFHGRLKCFVIYLSDSDVESGVGLIPGVDGWPCILHTHGKSKSRAGPAHPFHCVSEHPLNRASQMIKPTV